MSDDDPQQRLELYRLYLATAERVSDRRAAANTWMLSVNAAVIGLYGYLGGDRAPVPPADRWLWFLAVPAVGILLCLAWAALLASYRKLNAAKFTVLHELEAHLPYPLFRREQEIYRAAGRRPLGWAETAIPLLFAALYAGLLGVRLIIELWGG
ncbi:RipA family octameric membrane protein [Rhodobaculum claviforme]|uniref:Small integral membrane protein n=1 Tax=Rhodobaculum claviforme TaxID=1549854 RepID=A0A934TKJ4_9RHOB|nr:hypothetical protein [Rhodobaculum claviforme]MBK5927475.1 hypothetical protein [Rhodobaculum claviforme]